MKSAEIMIKVLQPFPGLRPFQKVESDVFFGRGEQIDALLGTLEENNVVAVVGASGSGKSSLVRAGLLPALEAGFLSDTGTEWRMILMRPGNAPFSQLAKALWETASGDQTPDPQSIAFTEATLRSGPKGLLEAIDDLGFPPHANVLLLVDQFEEIFRFRHRDVASDDEAVQRSKADERNDATAFINMLLATRAQHAASLYAVITMRSDFLGDCDAFHGLPEAINECQFLVPRLRRDQLRDCITMPLDLFGATADPGLVNRILNEIGSDSDQLPLMQHLLLRMWSQANRRCGDDDVVLRSADYDAVGGLENALSRHADEIFDSLGSEANKRVAELMFRCLCDQGAEARLTRRLVTVAEVAAVADVDADKVEEVADAFLHLERSFLTKSPRGDITPETTLDISHEALIRQWGRLADWVSREGQSATRYRRLAETARLWKDRQASVLVSPELDIALDWRNQERPTKAWAERYARGFALSMEFLDASVAERQAVIARQRNEVRRKTLLLVGTLAVVTSLMLVAGSLGLRSHFQAKELNDLLIESQLSLGTASIRDGRISAGLLRYWSAYEITRQDQPARSSALDLIASWSELAGRPFLHDQRVRSVAFSPDGRKVLTVTDHTAQLWDLETGEPMTEKVIATDATWQAFAVSPDATTVFVATGKSAQPWDVETGKRLGEAFEHAETIVNMVYSADGGTILIQTTQRIHLWDVQTGAPRGEPVDHSGSCAVTADGTTLAVGGRAPRLINVATGTSTPIPWELPDVDETAHPDATSLVAFSPDGKSLLTAESELIQVWNVASGEPQGAALQHTELTIVAFSADSRLVLTGSRDNTARLWDVQSGQAVGPHLQHQGTVVSATFSPDGETVLTGSADNTARLWDVATGEPVSIPLQHGGTVNAVAIYHDGQSILTGSVDRTARLWPRRNRRAVANGSSPRGLPRKVAFNPVVENVAIMYAQGEVEFINPLTGETTRSPLAIDPAPLAVDFSPGANLLLTAHESQVNLWDMSTGNKLPVEFRFAAPVKTASLGPAGRTILTASGNVAQLWDRHTTARPQQEFHHDTAVHVAVLSPDGRAVVTAGADTNFAQLWNAETGQPLGQPLQHGDVVLTAAFSPSGRLLATGSTDNTAAIWDVETLSLIGSPLPHRDAVSDVMFSPTGTTLLTGSDDTTARFWDVASGELRGDPMTHAGQVKTVRYHPDGRHVLTLDDLGFAWLWNVLPPAADEPARLRLSMEWRTGYSFDSKTALRPLTQAEWLQRKRSLDALGGPCDVRSWDDVETAPSRR